MPISWRPSGNKDKAMSHVNEAARLLAVNRQMLTASPAHMNFKSFERLEDGTEITIRSFRPSAIGASFAPAITSIVDIKAPVVTGGREEEIKEIVPGGKDFIYCLVETHSGSFWQIHIEKRKGKDGELVWQSPYSVHSDLYQITAVANGVYSCGWMFDNGNWDYDWRIEKHNPETGELIWGQTGGFSTFGGPMGLCADEAGVYVAGYVCYDDFQEILIWRVEKRDVVDGSIVWFTENQVDGWTNPSIGFRCIDVDAENVYDVNYFTNMLTCRDKFSGAIKYTITVPLTEGVIGLLPYIAWVDKKWDGKQWKYGDSLYIVSYQIYSGSYLWEVRKINKINGQAEWVTILPWNAYFPRGVHNTGSKVVAGVSGGYGGSIFKPTLVELTKDTGAATILLQLSSYDDIQDFSISGLNNTYIVNNPGLNFDIKRLKTNNPADIIWTKTIIARNVPSIALWTE